MLKALVKFLDSGETREIPAEEIPHYKKYGVAIRVLKTWIDLSDFMAEGLTPEQVMAEVNAAYA
jgi:hypothetical protein